jgi:hypothetical protein
LIEIPRNYLNKSRLLEDYTLNGASRYCDDGRSYSYHIDVDVVRYGHTCQVHIEFHKNLLLSKDMRGKETHTHGHIFAASSSSYSSSSTGSATLGVFWPH